MMSCEVDARVAVEVMGWKEIHGPGDISGGYAWFRRMENQRGVYVTANYETRCTSSLWSPSTSIADAWLVVEKLRRDGWRIQIMVGYPDKDDCLLANNHRTISGQGDTAPEAICLAALKAVGADQ